MTEPATDLLFALLRSYQLHDFPVMPVWGLSESGDCLCPDRGGCKRSKGKHPHGKLVSNGVKNSTLSPDVLKDWLRRAPDANWAIATGMPLNKSGGVLIVLDVDPRNGGDETLAQLETKHGKLPQTIRANSGGGGAHYYFRAKNAMSGRTICPGLDLKASGGYILCEPSRHASGGSYTWDAGAHPDETDLADAPDWLVEGTDTSKPRPQWTGESAKNTLLGMAFDRAGWLGVPLSNGAYAVRCPWFHEHSDGRGDGKDSSTVILPPISGTTFGSFVCSHRCSQKKWHDVLAALPAHAVQHAKSNYPLKPQAIAVANPGEVPAPVNTDWMTMFATKTLKSGETLIIPDEPNTSIVLNYDPRWQAPDGRPILRWDAFRQQIRLMAKPPWHPDDAPSVYDDYLQDQDITRFTMYCKRTYNFSINRESAFSVMNVVARRFAMHPVRDWLESLIWDETPRVDGWLTSYLGVPDSDYTRAVGKWWLLSAVARVFRPGCKADHVLILEGKQGTLKSTALRTLAFNREWFNDTPFELGNKDAFLALRGKWIVELAELDSLSRADSSRAKAFFSSPDDTYRPPYGRESITIQRQCIFAGTVNHDTYLRDDTGNRRYWPVRCTQIDIEKLRADVPQIWAEAVRLFQNGETWWPKTKEDHEICRKEQEDRAEQDAWLLTVLEWLSTPEARGLMAERTPRCLTIGDVLGRALLLHKNQWDRSAQIRVAKILTDLGWEKIRPTIDGQRVWAFMPTEI